MFTSHYLYFDTPDYMLDDILDENADVLWTKFGTEFVSEDVPSIRICTCTVRNKDAEKLENALRKLDWKMTIKLGKKYTDIRDTVIKGLLESSNQC